MQRSPDAHALLDRLDPDAPLAQRHLWLMAVLDWVRGDRSDALASARRVVALLDAAEQRTEWLPRWQRWWSGFHATVDVTPLLADHGFAPRTAFLSELGHRLHRKLLPATPETTDIGPLFDLLFPYPFDVTWLRALDGDTLARIDRLLELPATTHQAGKPLSTWQQALLDATVFSASQVSATGFAAEIRVRMSDEARHARHFHALPQVLESFRASVLQHGVQAPQTAEAAAALRQQLDNCRHAAYTVYSHLEAHGISVGIVFRLRQLRERVLRTKGLIDCLLAEQGDRASAALLADLVQVGQESRSVRQLIATSSHLTAARVAERSAESGEHYITRNMAEYRAMLAKAAGGGAVGEVGLIVVDDLIGGGGGQAHQALAHEGGHDERRGRARLHHGGHPDARQHGREPVADAVRDQLAQIGAKDTQDAGAHQVGAPDQQRHRCQQIQEMLHEKPLFLLLVSTQTSMRHALRRRKR